MRTVRTCALLVAAGLLATGCARLSGTSTHFAGSTTITVTTKDSGRTLAMHVGDRLVAEAEIIFSHVEQSGDFQHLDQKNFVFSTGLLSILDVGKMNS